MNEPKRKSFLHFGKIRPVAMPAAGLLFFIVLRIPAMLFDFSFLGRMIGGGVFKYFLLNILSIVLLVLVAEFLFLAGKKHRKAQAGQSGSAILEFAMVLPLALMIILVMVQACLLMIGNICVHNAAYSAARAAIVYIPADYASQGEGPNYLSEVDGNENSLSGKMRHIHKAACWALLGISYAGTAIEPYSDNSLTQGLSDLYQSYDNEIPRWVRSQNYLLRKLAYCMRNTSVTLDRPQNNLAYQADEDIKAYVKYDFRLLVPYSNVVLAFDPDYEKTAEGYPIIKMNADCMLTNEGVRNYMEIESFWN